MYKKDFVCGDIFPFRKYPIWRRRGLLPTPIVVKKRSTKKDDEAKTIVFNCTKEGCRYAFVDEASLERHMKTHEEGFEHVKCTHDGCLRVFETKKEMKQHGQTTHDNEVDKPFVCDVDGITSHRSSVRALWLTPPFIQKQKSITTHCRITIRWTETTKNNSKQLKYPCTFWIAIAQKNTRQQNRKK